MTLRDDIKAAHAAAQLSLDGIVEDIRNLKITPGMTEAEAAETKAEAEALAQRLASVDLENPAP